EAAWRTADEVYVRVRARVENQRFAIHPALLDAALHPLAAGDGPDDPAELVPVPFNWNGVHLFSTAATELLVRITRRGPNTVALTATDRAGNPVLTVESLTLRPLAAGQLRAASSGPAPLYAVDWTPLPPASSVGPVRIADIDHHLAPDGQLDALLSSGPPPDVVIAEFTGPSEGTDPAAAAPSAVRDALTLDRGVL